MNDSNISEYRPKYNNYSCIYCNSVISGGRFCRTCCSYIYRSGLSTKNERECLEALDMRDRKKQSLACIHCGKPSKKKSFCNTCYMYLIRKKIDMDDKELCLKILNNRDSWREKVKLRKAR